MLTLRRRGLHPAGCGLPRNRQTLGTSALAPRLTSCPRHQLPCGANCRHRGSGYSSKKAVDVMGHPPGGCEHEAWEGGSQTPLQGAHVSEHKISFIWLLKNATAPLSQPAELWENTPELSQDCVQMHEAPLIPSSPLPTPPHPAVCPGPPTTTLPTPCAAHPNSPSALKTLIQASSRSLRPVLKVILRHSGLEIQILGRNDL